MIAYVEPGTPGEMVARVRDMDWSKTALGSQDGWPQRLSGAVDVILAGGFPAIVLWGEDLVQIYNDGYRIVMGEKHPQGLGQATRDCWPEVWHINEPLYQRVLAGEACNFQDALYPIVRNGSLEDAWFTLAYSPLRDDDGLIGGVLVTVIETTARVLADQRIAALADQQHRNLQQMPGFVAVLSGPDHTYTFVNDAYVDLAGSRTYLDRTVREVFPDLSGQAFFALLDKVYASGKPFAARDMSISLKGDADERFLDFLYHPIRDENGQVTGIFAGGYDVSERVRAKALLRDSDAKLRALVLDLENQVAERARERGKTWDVSPHLLSVISLDDGHFLAVNNAWTQALGWPTDQVVGKFYGEFLHPDDAPASDEAFEGLKLGYPVLNFENRYLTSAGDYRWLSWVAVPADGKLYSTSRDITDERLRAAELEQAQESLRQSQKLEALGQLTGGVAHDFNNLLTIIRSASDFLRRPNLAEERRVRYVEAISVTVDRAAALIHQLLAFARRQPLKPQLFDVCDRVQDIMRLIQPLVGSRIDIVVDAEPGLIASADVGQFETAIVNLAVNARDAMSGEGKLTIGVSAANKVPAIRSHPAQIGRFVAISVSDTGSGIAAEKLDQIFEPFFTTKAVGAGTGLGLSQAFGFAKQSGGEITVTSQPGAGAIFTIYLPLIDAPADDDASDAAAKLPAFVGKGRFVLVVEDNAAVGEFTTELLHDLGYSTHWVIGAAEALAVLKEDPARFNLVFSDVVMAGMNGLELATRIRAKYPNLPVVLTSGYSEVLAQEGHRGFELIQKPYSVEALSRVLHHAIENGAVS
jgi:PAS domain S-box-containing protein